MGPGYRGSGRGGGRPTGARFGGPKLPSALREQVEDALGKPASRRGQPTRRDQRKSARMEKKQNRSQHYASSRTQNEQMEVEAVQPEIRPRKRKAEETDSLRKEEKSGGADGSSAAQKKKKKKKAELRLPQETAADAEDGEIEWLEYMLKKEKNKASDEDGLDDGLDDLLGLADLIGPGGKGLKRDDILDDDSDQFDDEESAEDFNGLSDFGDLVDSDEGSDGADESEEDEDQNGDDESDTATNEERSSGEGSLRGAASTPAESDTDEPMDAVADKAIATAGGKSNGEEEEGDGPTRYVPPQVRAAQLAARAANDTEKSQSHTLLVRRLQGLLNRLSEANIESILGEIEGLYRDHSRNEMTTSLTDLIIQTIADKANLLDSFVILYASLAGALHRIIGIEFGAHLVHSIILRYEASRDGSRAATATPLPSSIYETPDATKESLNLLTLIAELYNAQVISAKLIYDLVLGFINTGTEDDAVLGEREVEGLLRIIKCCGQQLRSDDPASLKDIVNLVQEKTAGKEKTMTTRARFMIETLANLRSGKSKARIDQGPDATQRMKRFLNGLGKKRRLMTHEPLRVSLSDLLNADKKGKWWLVGAGWSGNPLVEHQESLAQASKTKVNGRSAGDENAALLEMARKQGMNTDVRRNIFLILMTCEDFLHACDRFSQLRLTETQQREIVRVTFHCLSLEKTYNPYYTLVLNELCRESHSHRFTLQYALWDFMRMLDAADGDAKFLSRRADNVARAMAYTIAHGKMELMVFKAIDFTSLTSQTRKFFATTLTELLVSSQTPSPLFHLPKHLSAEDFDGDAVISIFERVLSHEGLTHGLTYILKNLESRRSHGTDRDRVIGEGISTAMSVLTGRATF